MLAVLAWFWILPNRSFVTRWHRCFFWTACFLVCFVQAFILLAEFYFFEEFRSRFNTVAVDYVWYPKEVFVNIWESYRFGIVLLVCFVLALVWTLVAKRLFRELWIRAFSKTARFLCMSPA